MIVSLHMPKVGGNSFLVALKEVFSGRVYEDYGDMSDLQRYFMRELSFEEVLSDASKVSDVQSVDCVHGHFLAAKYDTPEYDCAHFVTWLRDPVDRLVSHYNFFIRSYVEETAGPLFKRIIKEEWSLEDFCFSNEYRNIYTQYLRNFPVRRFSFVGVLEFYNEDLEYFSSKFLGAPATPFLINAGRNSCEKYKIDPGLRRAIEEFHALDVDLYRAALVFRGSKLGYKEMVWHE